MPKKTKITPVTTKGYAAVRREEDSGREWLDMDSYECLLDMAKESAAKLDAKIPLWAEANQVVRFATVRCEEQVL